MILAIFKKIGVTAAATPGGASARTSTLTPQGHDHVKPRHKTDGNQGKHKKDHNSSSRN